MTRHRLIYLLLAYNAIIFNTLQAQPLIAEDNYFIIDAHGGAPVYTTYTATMDRASLYGDKGYKMLYDDPYSPLSYGSEHGGRFFAVWEINSVVVDRTGEFYRQPVVKFTFPDMALVEYQPWAGLEVHELFFAYSSRIALVDCQVINSSDEALTINFYPVFTGADSLEITGFHQEDNYYSVNHFETRKRLISNLPDKYPYPTELADIFMGGFEPYSFGGYKGSMKNFYNIIKTDFYSDDRSDSLNLLNSGQVDFIAIHGQKTLMPGEGFNFRYFRGFISRDEDPASLIQEMKMIQNKSLQPFIDDNVMLFSRIPRIDFNNPEKKMIYLSAFNLVRGCMLPPTDETSYNYYVFSREPLWGWGHGHQVLHESLSMLAYAYLDPVSAQNSQRVYMEQQGSDGLIAYRHGPRGPQTYPHKGMPTTSAPFFSWINWEIFKISQDQDFLEDAYNSGVKYTEWLIENRDADQDGTFEWGPYGIIENVRDWYNAVFQVSAERYLDVDKEDISDELECLDLSLMVAKEMKCLAEMASQLNKHKDAAMWTRKADKLAGLINERMWNEEDGFFYSVDKTDHTFFFMSRDLKRQEIIGFLPLWAKTVSSERAEVLVRQLTDPGKFWRKYGIPTLSADDIWYSPYVDYCCKWNGPVWLLWDYMVFEGLLNYGYDELAKELAEKILEAVSQQLAKNHNFWESYSPDNENLNSPPNYIWDAIIARVLIELGEMENRQTH